MGRTEKRVFAAVLAVLLLALGGMLLLALPAGDGPPIYHITILTDGSDEAYWQNFRLGADRAARDRNADLRYLSRYEGEPGPAQAQALRGLWEEGDCDGVILLPVDAASLGEALSEAPPELAVAVAGAAPEGGQADCVISADPGEMGRRLAEAIARDGAETAALYLPAQESQAAALRRQGLTRRLEELGVPWTTVEEDGEDLALPPGRAAVALEPALAEALCQAAGAGSGPVYGIGSSDLLLHYLEEGTAAALVVQSGYDAGYLSLLAGEYFWP